MSYQPRDKELVLTLVPDEPNEKPRIAMIARRATRSEKEEFIVRLNAKLGSGQELEEETLSKWFESDKIFLCLFEDEIEMVHEDNILGPLTDE